MKMKIAFMSDIHLEICDKPLLKKYIGSGDVLVLAGDITSYPNFIKDFKWINSLEFGHVVYVAGNHEFYNGDIVETKVEIKNIVSGYDKIHYLDDEFICIDGVNFIGSTLWTDFDGDDPVAKLACQRGMNDYYYIHKYSNTITPQDILKEHKIGLTFLENSLIGIDPEKTVVITHHTPSYKSCPEFFKGDALNGGYHNNLDDLIMATQPKYWIHGHTHSHWNYNIGNTNILCNALGYDDVGEGFGDFKMNFFINI